MMEAIIDKGNREAMILILHAIWKEARVPNRILAHLVKEGLVGWALIDYIKHVHGGDIKKGVKEIELRMTRRSDPMIEIARRN